jgi:Fe-S oxidoreductase/FAD/FMN-containing dehydrogenase
MSGLSKKERIWLEEKFGARANFNSTERLLYSHDIAEVPGLFKPLVGDTIPQAVVQPANEEELIQLLRWAADNKIPLVPRGRGTSGYGGVLPARNGIVVDFYRMRRVLMIDDKAETATVEPGITWEQLDVEIQKKGLTLRLYPTSYPSSSVGGWLAQGGAGIGSFEFGWFDDNVLSVRIVLPSGEVQELSGRDMDIVSEAEGTTGFISRVTLRVQKVEDLEVAAVSCPGPAELAGLMKDIIARNLPLWSVVFINPKMAELKNKAPLRTHHGRPAEERIILPVSYIAILAFRRKDRPKVISALPDILRVFHGEVLSEKIAHHEWENRFKLMIVKRLGPSLVPAEVVVPLDNLDAFLTEMAVKVKKPVVKEGVLIKRGRGGKPEVVILGFIPSDQRKFSYNFVFGLVLSILKIANKYGGRPYATGHYFTRQAEKILGKERLKKIKAFKKSTDPKNILNPGKVIQGGFLARAVKWAGGFEPLVRSLGNSVAVKVGERPERAVRGLPADVVWYAYGCSQCGYCLDECDQFYGRGWESQSPRGKWYWLRQYLEGKADWDQFMVDTILVCTTCELCNHRCSASLPIEQSWMKLRGKLVQEDKQMTFPPFEMMAAAVRAEGNIWAGYRKNRTDWFPADLRAKHGPEHKAKNVYFAGCTISYVENDMGQAAVTLLDAAGVDFTYLGQVENCCGTPLLVAGLWDVFEETMLKNIAAVRAAGADTVITSCPACDMLWRHTYPEWAKRLGIEFGVKTKHYSEILSEKIKSGQFRFNLPVRKRVTWHDSCHIGRVSGVYQEPRDVIQAIPGVEFVEMAHHGEQAHCCGSVLTLIKEPPVAHDIGKIRLDEAAQVGAESVLALCPCCEFQLRVAKEKKNLPIEIRDLASFACESLGKKFVDPSPEVSRQWKVFEGMIALMTPKGFAGLMATMWPELLGAMPLGMGGMMRFMGKLGFAGDALFWLMKPLFPVLFPILLPRMMPKVMPAMLERVGAMIPMPDYMAEQMPDLMPKVMDNLMPKMLPDVVPLIVPKMVAYLRGRA